MLERATRAAERDPGDGATRHLADVLLGVVERDSQRRFLRGVLCWGGRLSGRQCRSVLAMAHEIMDPLEGVSEMLDAARGDPSDAAMRSLARALLGVVPRDSQRRFLRGVLCWGGRLSASQGRAVEAMATELLAGARRVEAEAANAGRVTEALVEIQQALGGSEPEEATEARWERLKAQARARAAQLKRGG